MKKKAIPPKLQCWIDARKRYQLSHAQVQMARELGLNPKKFGSLANHKQEPWKEPLPDFIESIYFKRFSKAQPDKVRTIEQSFDLQELKKKVRKEAKAQRQAVDIEESIEINS